MFKFCVAQRDMNKSIANNNKRGKLTFSLVKAANKINKSELFTERKCAQYPLFHITM